MALYGIARHGWSAGGGCGYQTSPAYPASCPDSSAPHGVAVHDRSPRGVDDVGASLHVPEQLVVEQLVGFRDERAVDREHVYAGGQRSGAGMERQAEFLFYLDGQLALVAVVQVDVEGS